MVSWTELHVSSKYIREHTTAVPYLVFVEMLECRCTVALTDSGPAGSMHAADFEEDLWYSSLSVYSLVALIL